MALELISGNALWGGVRWGGFTWGGAGSLALPSTLLLTDNGFDMRHEQVARALAHGAAVFGQEIQARDIVVAGHVLHEGSEDQHLAALNTLRQEAARPNLQLRYRSEFFVNLAKLRSFDQEWQELSGRTFSRVRIAWSAADPFWYASSATTVTEALAGHGTLTIDTAVGDWPARVEVWPVITITAPPGGTVPSVLLRNDSDEGMQLTYEDLQLRNGAAVVIDGAAATVERDGANSIRFFDGAFLRLVPGVNVLTYEGAACTLQIRYHARWI